MILVPFDSFLTLVVMLHQNEMRMAVTFLERERGREEEERKEEERNRNGWERKRKI